MSLRPEEEEEQPPFPILQPHFPTPFSFSSSSSSFAVADRNASTSGSGQAITVRTVIPAPIISSLLLPIKAKHPKLFVVFCSLLPRTRNRYFIFIFLFLHFF